ncbi:unnamed protein product [Peniophora sp. CBMAI 1063]|nr:unnamed protein product [Peniophora sp. CBMAI 1063]
MDDVTQKKRDALSDNVAQMFPSHLARLQSLASRVTAQNVAAMLGQHMPRLKRLYVTVDEKPVHYRGSQVIAAPELHTLYMNGISLPYYAPNLRSLRIRFRHNTQVLLSSLLDPLRSASLLESLELQNANNEFGPMDPMLPLRVPVDLPQLASLIFDGTSFNFKSLWKSIHIPLTESVSVEVMGRDTEVDVVRLLRPFFERPTNDTLRLFCNDDFWSRRISMRVCASADGLIHPMAYGKARLSGAQISAVYEQRHHEQAGDTSTRPDVFASALVANLIPESIRFLDLDLALRRGTALQLSELDSIRDALRPLVNVSAISVGRDSDMKILKELLCPESASTTSPFPLLRTLELKHLRDTTACERWWRSDFKDVLENWANLGILCTTLLAYRRPLTRVRVSAHTLSELGGDEDAYRAQERWIRGAQSWVDDLEITDLAVKRVAA